jgi:transposase InsO family protein
LRDELDRIIETRDQPKMIVSDNGTEFTSNTIQKIHYFQQHCRPHPHQY